LDALADALDAAVMSAHQVGRRCEAVGADQAGVGGEQTRSADGDDGDLCLRKLSGRMEVMAGSLAVRWCFQKCWQNVERGGQLLDGLQPARQYRNPIAAKRVARVSFPAQR
jgi:hypothetical protein